MTAAPESSADNALTGYRAVCHDLVQYVHAAMLVASMPSEPGQDAATQLKFDLIQRQLSQMHTVLENSLTTGRPTSANVVDLVRECVEANQVHHHVDLHIETPRARATGDHTALRRAVNNLLDNADRAARDDGRIVVRVSCSAEWVVVEVQDTGVGFGRLESGRGLGMVSVADALTSFRGSLDISSGPGPGTLVRLKLRSTP
ncbi:MAG: histidine kinase [Marmoricola sp.]|jgi:signal transduction histidine kinase|nr:histidine kinase [Marmoricola sp.]